MSNMDSGAYYAPYVPLQGLAYEYSLVEKFNGIHVVDSSPIYALWDIKGEPNTLYRVHSKCGKTSFVYPVDITYGYSGVSDDEVATYVADYIPHFKFIFYIDETRPFLKCTEEEFLMFVLKYGQDFHQG